MVHLKHILVLLAVCFTMSAFAQIIQEQSVQVVEVQKEPKISNTYSWQSFVVGGAAIGVPASFRLQAGMVKNWGFYVAGTTNFNFGGRTRDRDVGEEDYYYKWTGKKRYNRWIFQTGLVKCINPDFIIYCGSGFGKSTQFCETEDGKWMWSHHHNLIDDLTLPECDLGFIHRIKKSLVISAGCSWGTDLRNSYPTGNIGLGITF